nr:ubiquitin-conjugating enzyme E2 D1-like [Hydra vulgaris]
MDDFSKIRRLNGEISQMKKNNNPHPGIKITFDENNVTKDWRVTLEGPKDSLYEGGKFHATVSFPVNYPYTAPIVKFDTNIKHCNFGSDGNICISTLSNWTSATTVESVMIAILVLLSDPNPEDPLNFQLANRYKNDKKKYEEEIREWVKKHASSNSNSHDTKKTTAVPEYNESDSDDSDTD